MPHLATIAEYAKLRGCSRQAVEKAAATGRITLIDKPGGRKVDVDAANASWAAKTDLAQQERGAADQVEKSQALARGSVAKVGSSSGSGAANKSPKVVDLGFGLSYIEEKTRGERLKIRRQEIELEQLEGRSVSREAVVAALSSKLLSAGETLQGIPDRLAAVFASETDAAVIHRMLSAEIRAAMSAISTVPDALH